MPKLRAELRLRPRAAVVTHAVVTLALALFGFAGGNDAKGDALVFTQAMKAGTIAEYFVEPGRLVVELEIGMAELDAFANLLPDEIYAQSGRPPEPFEVRQRRFFERDLAVSADGGPPLPGRVLELVPRARVVRDEISGAPLPVPEGEEPEVVLFAKLAYGLPAELAKLTLFGMPNTAIGFVAYHGSVPVNDFRYLSPQQTLTLDWSDPWYTRFERRALRRQYYAPTSGFLYVEPYEVRKEIIVRPLDLQEWVDLGLADRKTIPVEMQADLKRKVAAFLRERHPVLIDGEAIPPDLAQINFLERTLRTSRVVDPPEELDVYSAVLGAIFVYPTTGLPQHATMEWDLFTDRIPTVPTSAVDEAGGLPTLLDPEWAVLEWKNFLTNPTVPSAVPVAAPPSVAARAAGLAFWPLLVVTAGAAFAAWRSARRGGGAATRPAALAAGLAALALVSFFAGRGARIDDARATEVVGALLTNVYRAFDYRDESRIYDLLAESVEGDLLEQIYLETRKGLELASQGGARAKVKAVEVIELHAEPAPEGAFDVLAKWNVGGSVGHWGHVHQRRNQYDARLRIAPADGVWKLRELEVRDEQRL